MLFSLIFSSPFYSYPDFLQRNYSSKGKFVLTLGIAARKRTNLKIFKICRLAGIAERASALAVGVLPVNKNVRVYPFRTFVFLRERHAIKPDDCEEKRYWEAGGLVEVSPLSPRFF